MTALTITAALGLAATVLLTQAEKSAPTPGKKMVFQPGSKTPEEEKPSPTPATDTRPPQQLVQSFFAMLSEEKIDEAYAALTRGSKIAEKESDIESLKSKTREAIEVFGEVRGYEVIAQREIGTRLASFTCVSFGKNFPLRWRFYFYRPVDEWKLIDIRVDDQLADIFDERDEPSSP